MLLLFMDVDGTLTDGRLNISESGELFKSFSVKDGYGINVICKNNNIVPAIITARSSDIVSKRASEINITEIYQGVQDKIATMHEIMEKYGVNYDCTAYIGDDIPDLGCMKLCRFTGCPADAVEDIKNACDYICKNNGGDGAVREFIEWLIQQQ